MKESFLLILFYSASGSVKNLAHAIADGAEEQNLNVKLRTVPKISMRNKNSVADIPESGEIYCSKEDLINCSGLAIGSPTRFGSIATPLKHFLDSTGDIWSTHALENKPGIAFTSTGSMHGGQETTLLSMMLPLLHHGMIIAGVPYSEKNLSTTKSGGTPYGPTHVSHNHITDLTEEEKAICLTYGKRFANIINKLEN